MLVPSLLVGWVTSGKTTGYGSRETEDQMVTRSCAFWRTFFGQPATKNQSSVTVYLPRDQAFTVAALLAVMEKVSRREPI